MSSLLDLWKGIQPRSRAHFTSSVTFTTEMFELCSVIYYVRNLISVSVTKEVHFWKEEIALKYEYLTIYSIVLSNGREVSLCFCYIYLVSGLYSVFLQLSGLRKVLFLLPSEFSSFSIFLYISGDSHSSRQNADHKVTELQVPLMCSAYMLKIFAELIHFLARRLNPF